jgi:hypothetical protein
LGDNALPKIRQAQDYFAQALEAFDNDDDLDARHIAWWKGPSYRFMMWRVRRSTRRMAEELDDVEAVTRHTGGLRCGAVATSGDAAPSEGSPG